MLGNLSLVISALDSMTIDHSKLDQGWCQPSVNDVGDMLRILWETNLVMPAVVRLEPVMDVKTLQDVWSFLYRPKRAKTDAGTAAKTLRSVTEKDEVGKRASALADWTSLVC